MGLVLINAAVASIARASHWLPLGDYSLVTVRYCAREDAISCKDSQLITPSVFGVAARNGLTDWRLRSKPNVDVMTLAAVGRSQPRRSQLTNGRIV